jgi:hypothetical protein
MSPRKLGESYPQPRAPQLREKRNEHASNCSIHGPRSLTGGSVGPEGRVIGFLLLGLTVLAFAKFYSDKRTDQPAPPSRAESLQEVRRQASRASQN